MLHAAYVFGSTKHYPNLSVLNLALKVGHGILFQVEVTDETDETAFPCLVRKSLPAWHASLFYRQQQPTNQQFEQYLATVPTSQESC